MQFHEYSTVFHIMQRLGKVPNGMDFPEFYAKLVAYADSKGTSDDAIAGNQFKMEYHWHRARRPYYCVWPSILPMFLRLKLSIDSGTIKPPIPVFNIRMPIKNNPMFFYDGGQRYEVKSILMGEAKIRNAPGISVYVDVGEVYQGELVYTFQNFQTISGTSVEDTIRDLPIHRSRNEGVQIPIDVIKDCVRLCCTICLLENDPDIISPDVLDRDRRRYEETRDPKIVERAIRRGKIGWHIGRDIEISPHIRGPHDALYWTGKGRSVPKIIFRKGSIVHRSKVMHVPTGVKDDEEPAEST